jgi:hypothetical protein
MQQPPMTVQASVDQNPPADHLGSRYGVVSVVRTDQLGVVYRAADASEGGAARLVRRWAPVIAKEPEFRARLHQRSLRVNQLAVQRAAPFRVFSVEGTAEGDLLLSTDATEARSLEDWLASNQPLGGDAALGLAIRIGEALEAAHNGGLVHGHLGPAHIDLSEPSLQVCLSGFEYGALPPHVLRNLDLDAPPFSRVHLSPEQRSGEEPLEAADIYAFGRLLESLFDVSASRPNRRFGRIIGAFQARSGVPSRIASIVQATIAVTPARRPRGIGEVLNDLWTRPAEGSGSGSRRVSSVSPRRVALSLAALAVFGGASVLAVHRTGRPVASAVVDQPADRDDRLSPERGAVLPAAPVPMATEERLPVGSEAHVSEQPDAPEPARPRTPEVAARPAAASSLPLPSNPPAGQPTDSRPVDTGPPPSPSQSPGQHAGTVSQPPKPPLKASATPRDGTGESRAQGHISVARERSDDAGVPDPGHIIDWLLEHSRARNR